MTYFPSAKTSLATCVALVALCGGGCTSVEYFDALCPLHHNASPYAIACDPCHGYHPTCWCSWSECCPACPSPCRQLVSPGNLNSPAPNAGQAVPVPPPAGPADWEIAPAPEPHPPEDSGAMNDPSAGDDRVARLPRAYY